MPGEVDHRPDVRLAWAVGTVVVLGSVGPVVFAMTVRDRLPAAVARHWAPGGRVTGTWSLSTQLLVLGTVTLLVAGTCGAIAVLSRQPLLVRRTLAGCGAWTATVLGSSQLDAIRGQIDLVDPFEAPEPAAGLAVGAVLGLALALAVAMLAREATSAVHAERPPRAGLPRLISRSEPSTWRTTAPPSRGLIGVAAATSLAFLVPALAGGWGVLVLGAVVVLPMVWLARFTVVVDRDGLWVGRGVLTLLRVPIEQVAGASVIEELDPFWEFGGWGLRVDVHGRTGLVSRRGEALSVVRADGSEVVVTIDDAHDAAATLNTLADQRHAG